MKKQTPKQSAGFKSGYSDVNGIKMYYEIHSGKGEPLVLIHGGGSNIRTTFGKMIPLLRNDFKLIAVELQAHGHTGDRNAPESFEQDADDVTALLHNLNISRASILGFSNGGNTAIQIAIRHPEILSKLVLASTFFKRDGLIPGFFDGLQHATIKDLPRSFKDAFLEINPDSNALQIMFDKDRERMLNFQDWKDEDIGSIKLPTLIIACDRDVITVDHTLKMSKLISDSRLAILPGLHGSQIGEAENPESRSNLPKITFEIIKNFMNE